MGNGIRYAMPDPEGELSCVCPRCFFHFQVPFLHRIFPCPKCKRSLYVKLLTRKGIAALEEEAV